MHTKQNYKLKLTPV